MSEAGTALSVVDAQKALLGSMDDKVKAAYEEIRAVQKTAQKTVVFSHYEIGRIVRDISPDVEYGANATAQLAEALGLKPNFLLECRRVAEQFTRKQVRKLATQKNACGRYIGWRHLVEIAGAAENPKLQKSLMSRVVTEALTVEQIVREIQAKMGQRNSAIGVLPPRSMSAGLQQIANTSENVVKRRDVFKEAVIAPLMKLKESDLTPRLLSQLDTAIQNTNSLHESTGEMLRELTTARERAQKIARARKEPVAEEESPRRRGKARRSNKKRKGKKAVARAVKRAKRVLARA